MKKIFNLIFCGAAALTVLASCDGAFLDSKSPSTFDGATVYGNYSLAEGTIFGITETFCEQNSYRGRFLPWYGFNTDIEWYNAYTAGKPRDNKNDIAAYDCQPNNSQLNSAPHVFASIYMGIERANLVIEGLREFGNTENDKDMAYLLGEALTLRSLLYYDLIKAWGDVPARFSALTSETIYAAKEDRDVIFKQILADLDEAIGYLVFPGQNAATAKADRINKAFAEGLYARIALAASGYALRPADGKVGTGDAGSVRLSSDPELQKSVLYPKALNYLKDVITSGTCSLEDSFAGLWKKFNNSEHLNAGGEVLYVIPFGDGRGRWNYTFAVKNDGASINGTAFAQGGQAGPVPSFFFDYAANDSRRNVSCANYVWNKDGSITPAGIAKWYFGKFRFDQMKSNPYTGGNDDGVKPVVMRYADILLMAAEIANELGELSEAKSYFLPVRTRACGEDAAEEFVAAISSKEDMFNKIVDERAFEFCGEFLRKGDLIRWNLLKTKLDEAKAKMYDLRDRQGAYDYLGTDIWYKLSDDECSVDIWGLGRDEQTNPGSDWEIVANYIKYDDKKKSDLYAEKIENIYIADPESHMFWPLFNDTITNSQGYLVNDYGY